MTICRSSSRFLLVLLAAAVMPAAAVAQGVGPVPESHTVRKGDTLWDIAARYFGDPFLWPQIYRLNTAVVEDPHWIYPDEVLRLRGGAEVSAVPAQEPAAQADMPAADTVEVTVSAMDDAPLVEAAPMADAPAGAPLFPSQRPRSERSTLDVTSAEAYRPLKRSEFYASGFLTEGDKLPWGEMLGSVTPPEIATVSRNMAVTLYSRIAVRPPRGAGYQVGDTLLLVQLGPPVSGFGRQVTPSGLARVVDVSRPEVLAEIIAQYGELTAGQQVLPAEPFHDGGQARAVPISDGVEAQVVASRDGQVLKSPMDVLYLDRGRGDGVAPGDIFELRRVPTARAGLASTVSESMGVAQVVHVRERSATVRLLRVTAPDIPTGTVAKQIAKLPS